MTDLANLANLLSPPEKAENKKWEEDKVSGKWKLTKLSALVEPCSYALLPLLSSSMGCLRAVMSRNEQRKRTTTSRSFFTGETCRRSHKGVPGRAKVVLVTVVYGSALIGENWQK